MSETFHFLEIQALRHGGFVVREASHPTSGYLHEELAAFSTLDEALAWMMARLAKLPETQRS